MNKFEKERPQRNISRKQTKILQNLKKKDLVFLPSDKGGEFCVISTSDYERAAFKHLEDGTIYKKVARMTAKTIENKINGTWRKVSSAEKIKPHVSKTYVSNNTDMPRFYQLVKTHKKGPDVKIRPIVSNSNGPTKKISWLLCNILSPVYKLLPTHLDSSAQLIKHIKEVDPEVRSTHNYPFSLDVCSLYTSIPPQAAIQAVKTKLLEHPEVRLPLRVDSICALLEVVLGNTYFSFESVIYKQVSGLPI